MTPDMTSMNCTEFEAALGDRLEETVDAATRRRMDAHKFGCAECAALLADLTNIRAEAAALPVLSPSHDLWSGPSGIEARIQAPVVQLPVVHSDEHAVVHAGEQGGVEGSPLAVAMRPARRSVQANPWRLAAAATILVAATAGVTWVAAWTVAQRGATLAGRTSVDSGFAVAMAATRNVRNASSPAMNETYDTEIATLRRLVDERRGELDSATVATLDKNLKVIDDAIAACKAAIAADPASAFLLDRLSDAYDTKLRTLRAVAAMPQRG